MRFLVKNINPLVKFTIKTHILQIRNFAKALESEKSLKILREDTFTGRILLYLNSKNNGIQPKVTNRVEVKDGKVNLDSKTLHNLDVNEIISALNSLPSRTNLNCGYILKKLDVESCLRLIELQPHQIFELLKAYINTSANRIMQLRFYRLALEELHKSLEALSKNDLLKFIFYIGLQKKTNEAQIMLSDCLRKIINDDMLNYLTTEELCIVCNSCFKTSTKIKSEAFLNKVKNAINDNLDVMKDAPLFITLIKTLRHNRFQDDDLLNTISCTVFFNKTLELYSFTSLCHILALYSDYLYYHEKLVPIFVNKCLDYLKNVDATGDIRAKDIKRFLWILSNFSYHRLIETTEIKTIVVPEILKRIQSGEFDRDPEFLIDMTLYLWMIGYRPYEIVPYSLTKENVLLIQGSKTKTKQRLTLLLFCIHLEDPKLFSKLDLKLSVAATNFSQAVHITQRPLLARVFSAVKCLANKLEINRFELTQEVPNLNIVGITGYKKKIYKAVFIEVMDEITTLKNCSNEAPTGLMDLKLRLLDHSDEAVIVISEQEVEDMTETELEEFLLEEINLVC